MDALVVNGPNLNLLGHRNPEVYGSTTAEELDHQVRRWGVEMGLEVGNFQSNHEGALVDRIHKLIDTDTDLVINAGALTHYSYVLRDALEAAERPTVEVHISNVHDRESWRRRSVIEEVCDSTIVGRGVVGYRWALQFLAWRRSSPAKVESYGNDPRQRLSVRDGSGTPLALVHSGLADPTAGWDQVEAIAAALGTDGRRVLSVEYRPGHAGVDVNMALSLDDHQGQVILDGDAMALADDLEHDIILLDPPDESDTDRMVRSGGNVISRIFHDRSWLETLEQGDL